MKKSGMKVSNQSPPWRRSVMDFFFSDCWRMATSTEFPSNSLAPLGKCVLGVSFTLCTLCFAFLLSGWRLRYLMMVNLSLFLFNLLPLGNLDGQHFLHSMMLSSNKDDVFNLDALERAETPDESRWGMLEKVICRGTGVLVALDSVLTLLALIRI